MFPQDDSWCSGKNAICRESKCYAPKRGYQECNPEDGIYACHRNDWDDLYDEYGTQNSCVKMHKGYAGLDHVVWECRPPNNAGK